MSISFKGQIIGHSSRHDKRSTMLKKINVLFFFLVKRYKKTFCCKKNVKRAIECTIPRCSSFSGSQVMRQIVEKCWNRQNSTFDDLWWPDLWPDLKMDKTFAPLGDCCSPCAPEFIRPVGVPTLPAASKFSPPPGLARDSRCSRQSVFEIQSLFLSVQPLVHLKSSKNRPILRNFDLFFPPPQWICIL